MAIAPIGRRPAPLKLAGQFFIRHSGEAGPDPELAETWAAMKTEGDRMLAEGRLDGFWTYLDLGSDCRGYMSTDDPLAMLWAIRQAAEGRLDAQVFGE